MSSSINTSTLTPFPELSDIHRGYAAAPTDDILKTMNGGVAAKI